MDNNKAFSVFGLTTKQTQILFSFQRMLVLNDIPATASKKRILINSEKKANVKQQWLIKWEKHINMFLSHLDDSKCQLLMTTDAIGRAIIEEEKNTETNIWKYLILLECCLFKPYTPLGGTQQEIDESGKLFAGQKLDKDSQKKTLLSIATLLRIDSKYIEIFLKRMKSVIKKMSNYWWKVGTAAGIGLLVVILALIPGTQSIAAALAPEGLSGAAAISAGLAALGGGAVAAGGFGMAGGIAVLVGGGSLLGIGAGGSIGMAIASMSSNAVLSEAAKMEVVLKEIVLAIQKDTILFQSILNKLSAEKEALKIELEKLQRAQKENEKKIKELEKSIKYFERLIKDLR